MRRSMILSLAVLAFARTPIATAQQLVEAYGRWVKPSEVPGLTEQAERLARVPTYGTTSTSRLTLGPCDATSRGAGPYIALNCDVLTPPFSDEPGLAEAAFPIHLPTGALITSVTVNYFDNTDGTVPGMGVFESDSVGTSLSVIPLQIGQSNAGLISKTVAVDPPYQVDGSKALALLVILHSVDMTHYEGFITFNVDYKLQVSPAPVVATFADVPTDDPFFQFVEALAASGITVGCGGGNFCPDQPLTRGQMAVFLAKALGLHFPN
jgi:hypothetical protein